MALGLAVWAILNWILGPLNRAANNRQYPIQYSLADLLFLFVLVQFPIGLIRWMASATQMDRAAEVAIDIVVLIIAILLWWNTARLLSRAGVHTVWRRAVILIIAVPSLIAGPFAIFIPLGLAMDKGHGFMILIEIPIIGFLYWLGLFTRAAVASAKTEAEMQDAAKEP